MRNGGYDEIAEWYDEQIRGGRLIHDLALPALFDLAGDIRGHRICDLACGQGVVARCLAEQGAVVAAIDLSTKLLAIAARDEAAQPLGITYLHEDAQSLASIGDAAFDGVIANMALMDIPDLGATLRTVRRILRPRGWFVFTITHPMLDTALGRIEVLQRENGEQRRVERSYFREGAWRGENPDGVRGKIDTYHRTISSYVNALCEAGLIVERMAEPEAAARLAERTPHLCRIPGILAVRARRSKWP